MPPSTKNPQLKNWIVVLAKQPIAGQSKTRLARDIGVERAQALAEAFVLDTLELTANQADAQVMIAFAPKKAHSWFAEHAPAAELVPQPETTFGERIQAAMVEAFQRGAERCVVMGMDTPHLGPSTLTSAFAALDQADACIGPSEDGGYYLVGVREPQPALFIDIPWSTPAVRSTTLQRASQAGLRLRELQLEVDVDDGEDLKALQAILRERPACAARTRRVLSEQLRQPL